MRQLIEEKNLFENKSALMQKVLHFAFRRWLADLAGFEEQS
jgi:hypothetical protein